MTSVTINTQDFSEDIGPGLKTEWAYTCHLQDPLFVPALTRCQSAPESDSGRVLEEQNLITFLARYPTNALLLALLHQRITGFAVLHSFPTLDRHLAVLSTLAIDGEVDAAEVGGRLIEDTAKKVFHDLKVNQLLVVSPYAQALCNLLELPTRISAARTLPSTR